MNELTLFWRGMTKEHITQTFHSGHEALDIVGNKVGFGYGTPLCAPENCKVLGITKEELTHDNTSLEAGYGIRLKGVVSGHEYLFWHCLPLFPVWGGDLVTRGQIVAFMGNSGYVISGVYVPLEKRLVPPYLGTHVHAAVHDPVHRINLNPIPLINWRLEPTYTKADYIVAMIKVLQKAVKLI